MAKTHYVIIKDFFRVTIVGAGNIVNKNFKKIHNCREPSKDNKKKRCLEMILVSAIITTYERPENLYRAIRSVLNQSYENIEIIVVDDNNENSKYRIETEKIIKSFLKKGIHIHYYKHKKNKGGSAARNTGIKNSKGSYIAFLDDDDEWTPEKVKKQVETLNNSNNKIGAVYTGIKLIKQNNNFENLIFHKRGNQLKNLLLNLFTPGSTSTLMFKKKVLDELNGFDETFQRHQDLEILIRLFRNYEIEVINEPLVLKYGFNFPNANNLENIKRKYLNTFMDDINKFSFADKRKIFATQYFQISKFYLKEKKYFNGLKYFILSYYYWPLKVYYRKNFYLTLFRKLHKGAD